MNSKVCFAVILLLGIALRNSSVEAVSQSISENSGLAATSERMRVRRSARLPCENSRCTFACMGAASSGGSCVNDNLCWCFNGNCDQGKCFSSCMSQHFSTGFCVGNACQCRS